MVKTNIILLGAPGSGKGTLAKKITAKLGFSHISTGDLFRTNIKEKTPLGLKVQSVIAAGNFVDDTLTNEVLADALKRQPAASAGIIFDGYPRTHNQAKFLDEHAKVDFALVLDVADQVVTKRVTGRRTCSKCGAIYHIEFAPPQKTDTCDVCGTSPLTHRPDDNATVIKERLSVYYKNTEPLIDYYAQSGRLERMDATELDGVLERFQQVLQHRAGG